MMDFLITLIGPLLFLITATIFLIIGNRIASKRKSNCSGWPIGKAEVIGIAGEEDGVWLCKLVDGDGRESVCLSDLYAHVDVPGVNSPVVGSIEEVHVSTYTSPDNKYVNGKKIVYVAHFCNEQYYGLDKRATALKSRICYILSLLLYLIALITIIVALFSIIGGAPYV